MKQPTDYTTLANRCPNCGHRLSMRDGTRCIVVTNGKTPLDPKNDRQCDCRLHVRS